MAFTKQLQRTEHRLGLGTGFESRAIDVAHLQCCVCSPLQAQAQLVDPTLRDPFDGSRESHGHRLGKGASGPVESLKAAGLRREHVDDNLLDLPVSCLQQAVEKNEARGAEGHVHRGREREGELQRTAIGKRLLQFDQLRLGVVAVSLDLDQCGHGVDNVLQPPLGLPVGPHPHQHSHQL